MLTNGKGRYRKNIRKKIEKLMVRHLAVLKLLTITGVFKEKFMTEFKGFQSIARLSRDMVITEKLDGTNASITITDDGQFLTGSRTRWITPDDDNYGFSKWAHQNKQELLKLGVGSHFGEWWGEGIQRKYGIKGKRFSLFNVGRWNDDVLRPSCCHVVPTLHIGLFETFSIMAVMAKLENEGSAASPGFMKPEGIVIYHKHSNTLFKKTFEGDERGKSYGN